jgi:hypothetical protein
VCSISSCRHLSRKKEHLFSLLVFEQKLGYHVDIATNVDYGFVLVNLRETIPVGVEA